MAPILCANVNTYRAIERSGAMLGQWLAIIGVGGFGHIADQYAKAMGLRVAAADVSDEKLAFAERLSAEDVINARLGDPGVSLKEQTAGDAHRAAVTAVSPPVPLSSPSTYCALQAISASSACL